MDLHALPDAALPWLQAVRARPGVRGVLLAGGAARGDVWPGSDLDLYVVSADARPPDVGRPDAGPRFVDVHHVPAAALAALTADSAAFAASPIVDETAGGVPLHDPDGLLQRWVDGLAARLADPVVRRARAVTRLTAARAALAAADAEADPLEAALLARDAARLGAWAYVAGRGGLIASARRFADRFLAQCPPTIGGAFGQVWGLGGGRAAVDASIVALCAALRGALDAAVRRPPQPPEHFWVAAYRAADRQGREAFLALHPLPSLLEPTLACGYHDGALMWMRGYYRLGFRDLCAALTPGDRPGAELRRFHGLSGGELERCRTFLQEVAAALDHP